MDIEQLSRGIHQAQGNEQVAKAFRAVAFPITKQELIASLADTMLSVGGTETQLGEIVRGVPQARFRDASHAERAVGQRLQGIERSLQAVTDAEKAFK